MYKYLKAKRKEASSVSPSKSYGWANLVPLLRARCGFKHGAHKMYPTENHKRVPLCNLYGSMLQRFGLEIDQFNKGSGTLTGLETA